MIDKRFLLGEGSLFSLNMTLLERALSSDRTIRSRLGRKPYFVTRIVEKDYLNLDSYLLMGRNSPNQYPRSIMEDLTAHPQERLHTRL